MVRSRVAAPRDAEPYTDLYSGYRMAKPFQGLFTHWLNSQGSSFLRLRLATARRVATLGFVAQSLWDSRESPHRNTAEREQTPEKPEPSRSQSRRDCALQPRVARNELPWVQSRRGLNPERVVAGLVRT